MKKLFLLLSIILIAIGCAIAQKPLTINFKVAKHTVECQACYKTYTYETVEIIPDWSSISDTEAIKDQVECYKTWVQYKLKYGMMTALLNAANIEKSKCQESNSGEHLWKEIKYKVTETQTKTFNRDENWCTGLEKIKQDDTWVEYILLLGLISEIDK